MANEWFCKLAGTEIGPLSPQQLKAMAVKGRLTPEDEIRRGQDGKWSPAAAVAGLFPKADSSAAWADTQEIPVVAAGAAPASKPAAKSKPAARAVKPLDLPVAKAAPQPPAGDIPVAMPVAAPIRPVPQPVAVVAPAANPMPVAVGPGRTSTRIGRRDDAEPLDPKQRKKQKQKMLVFGLAGVIGLLAIAGIIVAIVRSSSSGTPVASADDSKTAAKTTEAAPGESAEDFGTRPGERKTGADTGTAKTAAEAAKPDAVKPTPAEKPAKPADPGWHTAGGDAAVVGDVSLKVPAVTLKTVTANRIRGKEVVGQVVIERLLVRVETAERPVGQGGALRVVATSQAGQSAHAGRQRGQELRLSPFAFPGTARVHRAGQSRRGGSGLPAAHRIAETGVPPVATAGRGLRRARDGRLQDSGRDDRTRAGKGEARHAARRQGRPVGPRRHAGTTEDAGEGAAGSQATAAEERSRAEHRDIDKDIDESQGGDKGHVIDERPRSRAALTGA